MELFKTIREMGHEQVAICSDKASGYCGIIAIHDTRLGPALGGTRFWNYDTEDEAIINNAQRKQQQDNTIQITVYFACAEQIILSVCDTGTAVPNAIALHLFENPINSAHGLGIGLYQAAKQATQTGYTLKLANNQPGAVCFVLSSGFRVDLPLTRL